MLEFLPTILRDNYYLLGVLLIVIIGAIYFVFFRSASTSVQPELPELLHEQRQELPQYPFAPPQHQQPQSQQPQSRQPPQSRQQLRPCQECGQLTDAEIRNLPGPLPVSGLLCPRCYTDLANDPERINEIMESFRGPHSDDDDDQQDQDQPEEQDQ